jgi:hypothetical protein
LNSPRGEPSPWRESSDSIHRRRPESTGVYWIPLFALLDSRGFTLLLVNARHVKNVAGRKSDVPDCQWLQQLMSYGPACRLHPRPPAAIMG